MTILSLFWPHIPRYLLLRVEGTGRYVQPAQVSAQLLHYLQNWVAGRSLRGVLSRILSSFALWH